MLNNTTVSLLDKLTRTDGATTKHWSITIHFSFTKMSTALSTGLSTGDSNRKKGKLQRQSTIKEAIGNEHLIKLEELCAQLNTDFIEGLTSRSAKKTLKTHGFNVYSKPKSTYQRALSRLFRYSNEPRQMIDNSWTKRDWNRVFNANAQDEYLVIRNRQQDIVRRREIVPGDLLSLQPKQVVPADMRVISYEGELVVDNRIVTGNSAELKSITSTSNDFLLSQNMIFAGTEILSGSCKAIVLKTGNDTVFGQLTQFSTKVRLTRRHGSVSFSSTSSGSTNSIGTIQSRDEDYNRSRLSSSSSAPPSPLYI